eukprot:1178105-Prorocentrum_minimum.AAC.1
MIEHRVQHNTLPYRITSAFLPSRVPGPCDRLGTVGPQPLYTFGHLWSTPGPPAVCDHSAVPALLTLSTNALVAAVPGSAFSTNCVDVQLCDTPRGNSQAGGVNAQAGEVNSPAGGVKSPAGGVSSSAYRVNSPAGGAGWVSSSAYRVTLPAGGVNSPTGGVGEFTSRWGEFTSRRGEFTSRRGEFTSRLGSYWAHLQLYGRFFDVEVPRQKRCPRFGVHLQPP